MPSLAGLFFWMNRKIENINKITITKPLKLDCGKTIKNFPLAYETYGKLNENKEASAIILTPTRELAIQVNKHIKDLMGNNIKIKSVVIIGGDSIQKQVKLIKNKAQLIIGTPGRICDHLNKGTLNLNKIKHLVLDETDRMLDLGFSIQIKKIIKFIESEDNENDPNYQKLISLHVNSLLN